MTDLNEKLLEVTFDLAAANAVKILNEALELEPFTLPKVFEALFCVGVDLIEHPTIQVTKEGGVHTLSVLGLINGLFGVRSDGLGRIAAIYNGDTGELIGFELTEDLEGLEDEGSSHK